MQELANFISSIGFPIFVAVWMLYKSSKDSEETRNAINELKIAITALTSEVAHHPTKGSEENE